MLSGSKVEAKGDHATVNKSMLSKGNYCLFIFHINIKMEV